MNWTTFLMGASALAPFWRLQALESSHPAHYKPYPRIMKSLRNTGREMEEAMYRATGGVNTHKGLVYALSILVGACAACFAKRDVSRRRVFETSGEIAAPSAAEDLRRIRDKHEIGDELTNGERIYVSFGVGGIRTEAAAGFPSVRKALESFEESIAQGAPFRAAAVRALLVLMDVCEDTNIIHRAGMEFWRGEYKEVTRQTLREFNPLSPGNYEPIHRLNDLLVQRRASPGGAADLLACTLFMYRGKIPDNKRSNT
jgi:triphosphoribosyl-dephospho-CoA synthetase